MVAHFLFAAYRELDEGELTRLRASVVSEPPLAHWARELELERALTVGKGMRQGGLPRSVLADALEAVIGAVYLDGGLDAARPLILWGLADALETELTEPRRRNWKSLLQELTQQTTRRVPTYAVLDARGPDHRRVFVVAALIDGSERGRGEGPSKKTAEQAAAQEAFQALKREHRRGGGG